MKLKAWYDKLESPARKNVRDIALVAVVLGLILGIVAMNLVSPANAQFVGDKPMQGRGPEQDNHYAVDFQTTDGRRVGRGGQMSSLPPIGYVYIAATARRERGVQGYAGPRYRVVGGEFTDVSCSSTKCVSNATVFVVKE